MSMNVKLKAQYYDSQPESFAAFVDRFCILFEALQKIPSLENHK